MRYLMLMVVCLAVARPGVAADEGPGVTADQAMERLQAGNARFTSAKSMHAHQDRARLSETAAGQHPFATILACSDSRLPVELLFDQGVGDVFVVRVAGNVCGVHEAGSIEYGVDHLKTPLLVVLGHSHCGAVTAVVTDAKLHGNIPALVHGIRPAVESARKSHPDQHGAELVPAAVTANVWQSVADLFKNSPTARELVAHGRLKVVGAVYELDTGKTVWLGEHPDKVRLLKNGDASERAGHGTGKAGGVEDEHP